MSTKAKAVIELTSIVNQITEFNYGKRNANFTKLLQAIRAAHGKDGKEALAVVYNLVIFMAGNDKAHAAKHLNVYTDCLIKFDDAGTVTREVYKYDKAGKVVMNKRNAYTDSPFANLYTTDKVAADSKAGTMYAKAYNQFKASDTRLEWLQAVSKAYKVDADKVLAKLDGKLSKVKV